MAEISPSNNYQNVFKALFVMLFFFCFNLQFCQTTMLYYQMFSDHHDILRLYFDKATNALLVLSIFFIIFVYKGFKDRFLAISLVVISLIYSHVREINSNNYYLAFFLLLVCSKNTSYKLIARIALVCGTGWIVYSAIACRLGYISDIIFGGRHSFGSIYVTDLFCHFLTLFMLICVLRRGKLKFFDYLLAFFILLLNAIYMKAKVGFLCFILLLAGTFFYQFIRPKCKINFQAVKVYSFITSISFILLAIISLWVSYTYSSSPEVWYNRFSFLRTLEMRFRYGYQAFENYDILSWGQYVAENGNGGRTDGKVVDNYYFLDISYVRILFFNGWITLLVLLGIFTSLQVKLYKHREYYLLFVVAVFALDCGVEHHIMELSYSLLPYLIFTAYRDNATLNIEKVTNDCFS